MFIQVFKVQFVLVILVAYLIGVGTNVPHVRKYECLYFANNFLFGISWIWCFINGAFTQMFM